jgi:hypothetical protein
VETGSITKVSAVLALWLAVAACTQGPPKAAPIGEAFVGPATLKIRSDFPLQSATVATVRHGDRLEILQVRRKFIRVRTPSGAEGWTDERQLLAATDMAALRDLGVQATKMPSQGLATVFAPLNIHNQPALSSPSFLQLKENEKIEVLRTVLFPRSEAVRTPLVPRTPKKKVEPKKRKSESKIPPPPLPKPPSPPSDWLELSKTNLDQDEEQADEPDKPAPKIDSWSLVRLPQGQAGWALTRMLTMAIPDEVAQYAEGRRIVSYFALGEIEDGDQKKKIWLWTTAGGHEAWDFDSFRVFIWSLRRHRYETAYIERNLHGYAPVLLKDVSMSSRTGTVSYPGFSVCVENKEAQRMRREYALLGNIVRYAGEQPCEPPPPPIETKPPAPLPVTEEKPAVKGPGFWDGLKRRFLALRKK